MQNKTNGRQKRETDVCVSVRTGRNGLNDMWLHPERQKKKKVTAENEVTVGDRDSG